MLNRLFASAALLIVLSASAYATNCASTPNQCAVASNGSLATNSPSGGNTPLVASQTFTVSNMNGIVSNVTISFNSWNFLGYASDPYFELVSPSGQRFDFFGGLNGGCINQTNGTLNVTFSDSGSQLPQNCLGNPNFSSGTYKPDVDASGDTGSSTYANSACPNIDGGAQPICANNEGSGTFATAGNGVFKGIAPNGTWTVYYENDYTGDSGTITSLTLNLTTEVTATSTTTTVSSSASQAFTTSPNNSLTYTATVTSGGSAVTEGSVQFYDNGSTIGSPVATSSGTAQYTAIFSGSTPEGVHRITATYSDTNSTPLYTGSNSNASPTQVYVDNHTTVSGGTFCNNGTISAAPPASGNDTTTYPQHVFVSGLSGGLAAVTLTLNSITSNSLSDLDFLLVAPSGAAYVPMAEVGTNSSASGITLTLTDSGASYLPTGANPSSATYKPADYNSGLTFPNAGSATILDSPAASGWALSYNQGSATMDTTFASENILNATQPWSLYLASRNNGDTTTMAGYCLAFLTNGNTATTTTLSASPNPATSGATVVLTAHVTAGGSNVTTGSVIFYNGTTELLTQSLDGSGNATYTSTWTEGMYSLSAQYTGQQGQYNESSGTATLEVDNTTSMTNNGSNSYSFCNAGTISIAASAVPLQYPSRIFVTGLAGTVASLGVTLDSITYPTPHDLEMLLEGPGGATNNVVFWGNIGSSGASALSGQTFTIEDGQTVLPSSGSFSGGTYSPAAYSGTAYAFPSPAPSSANWNYATSTGTTTFANQFANQDPDGTYQLFVYHNANGSTGSIGEHCVNITVNPPVLSLSGSHSGSFTQGDTGDTYTITVANPSGPGSTAGTLTLTDTLPTGLTATAFSQTAHTGGGTGSDWSCTTSPLSCTRTSAMAPGESDTLTLTVDVAYGTANSVTNSASVSGGGISATQSATDPTTVNAGTGAVLTTSVSPLSSGTISANPTNSNGFATGHFIPNTVVTLTATPASGYAFSSWSSTPGSVSSSSANPATITMSAAESVTALFSPVASIISVNAGSSQTSTVGSTYSTTLQALVTNSTSVPVSGVLVTFAAPGSGASVTFPSGNTASTNSQGVASVTVTANTVAGLFSVLATASGVTGNASFSLHNTAGSAASITITAGNNQAVTVGSSFSALHLLVKDSYSNVVPSANVTFTAPATGASGTFSNSTNSITLGTDSNGAISAAFAANTTAGGPYSVTLAASGVTAPPSFSFTNNPGPASIISITAGASQSVPVGSAFTPLQILLKDSNGNPVPNTSVTLTAPATGPGGTFSNSTNTITLNTNVSGAISTSFSANTTAGGPYSVTLTASGVTSPPSFSLTNNPGAPSTITITGGNNQTATAGSGFSPLQLLLKDSYGNLVPNATVTLTAPATGPGGTFSNSSTTISLTTGANGSLSAPFTANNTAGGPYSVVLSAAGVSSPPSFSLTNNPAPLSTITITAGNGQAVTTGSAFSPLQLLLKDANGNPVPNASITFTAPATGPSGTFTNNTNTVTLTTGPSGSLSTAFTANSTAGGPYTITLSAAGVTAPPSFSLTNLAAVVTPPPAPTTPIVPSTTNASVLSLFSDGSAANSAVTLTNTAANPQKLTQLSLSGPNASDFTVTSTCATMLLPNTTCSISPVFTPSVTGNESATLTINYTDTVTSNTYTQTVALTGQGVAVIPSGNVEILNRNSGKALDVLNASMLDGAPLQQYDYLGLSNQQWQLVLVEPGYYKILNVNSGLVLDVTGESVENGATIQQWAYWGGDNQKWSLTQLPDGSYQIANKLSGKLLDVTALSTADMARLQQWSATGANNQKWDILPAQQYFTITNQGSGKVLDVTGYSKVNGTLVQQWTWLGGLNQQWQFVPLGNGNYQILNRNSGKTLDATDPTDTSTPNGTLIQQYDFLGLPNQQWQLIPSGNGYYEIANASSGKALDVIGMSTLNGAGIQLYTYAGTENQQWHIDPVH